jgi:glycosyltransferase involved in cell wall biosynthesis
MSPGPPLLYVSFDQTPAAKGASTHIEANARALGARFGSVVLATPGPRDLPVGEFAPGVRQVVLGCPDADLLGRVLTFRVKLLELLRKQSFEVIHFRSTFEGYPLARRRAHLGARLLYEVNGLPSVELKYAHPRLGGEGRLLSKMEHQEAVCLSQADRVFTVSEVTRGCLAARGCPIDKVAVIPNGVDGEAFSYRDPPLLGGGVLRILYTGTLSPWQGVDDLLEAFLLVVVYQPAQLTLLGPAPKERRRELERRVRRAGLERQVAFHGPGDRATVARLLHESHVAVVPLTDADRNTVQGCCPLKLLEAMAAGCPVVASDLPVIRELGRPGEHLLATPPGDPAGLALSILRAANEGEGSRLRARRAREHVMGRFRWDQATARVVKLYEELLATSPSSRASAARSQARL